MSDPAHRETDRLIKKIEKRISVEYRRAEREVEAKLADYLRRFEIKDETWRRWVAEGTKTRAEYRTWRTGQMAVGERWEALRDSLAADYHNANQIARSIVKGYMPEVYAINHNYATYEVEHGLGVDTSYTLYSRETVERILRDDPSLLPPPGRKVSARIAAGKDILWNRNQIQSVMLQSVLQGDPIPAIATRLAETVGDSNRKAAIRNARTMATGAQNAGRIDGYARAESLGVKLEKMWLATLDKRTRHSHRDLDGESVPIKEEFSNGLMYPGDPDGDGEEIYNCFLGETYVATDSEIIRSYCHEYSGEVISIKSACGVEFTCTPNHPILTGRGWVPARLIHKGDNLLVARPGDFKFSGGNPDVDHVFSRFDAVHDLLNAFGRKRVGRLRVNFHGDIPTSDVEVISKERLLTKNGDICKPKEKGKMPLKDSDFSLKGFGTFVQHLRRIWVATLRFVGSMGESFAFFWWRLCHPKIHRLRPVALLNSGRVKALKNDLPATAEMLGDCLDGFTGVVFSDNVIDSNVSVSNCHVYNLQTENGYYFVNSIIPDSSGRRNGIAAIAHNCRCTMIADLQGFEIDASEMSLRRDEKLEGMSYEEWKDEHSEVVSNPITLPEEKARNIKGAYNHAYRTGTL